MNGFSLVNNFCYVFFENQAISSTVDCGPTRETFSMRFEAMHSYFKNIMRITQNFKNPPWTMAYRYECLRCCQMLTEPGKQMSNYLDKGVEYFSVKPPELKDYCYSKDIVHIFDDSELIVISCKKI